MGLLSISENIVKLRHEKKLTQEQLADFLEVTKASVSKWETGQSMPDVLMLPRLASFFGVTVDGLIGYEPQLSKEQCQKLYQEFAADFSTLSFEEVMEKTRRYAKQYYSCYPFLEQLCVLWLNHAALAGEEGMKKILHSIVDLCGHIRENCRDVGVCRDTAAVRAIAGLQLGQAAEVADDMEEIVRPYRFATGGVLAQAYRMLGEGEKAESLLQACMHGDVLALVSDATSYLAVKEGDLSVCKETIRRIEKVMEAYDLQKLHPNSAAVFEYHAMLCCLQQGERDRAVAHGEKYVDCLLELFGQEEIRIHGDGYFDKVDKWLEELPGGPGAPRSRLMALQDSRTSLEGPLFESLNGDPEWERIKKKLLSLDGFAR